VVIKWRQEVNGNNNTFVFFVLSLIKTHDDVAKLNLCIIYIITITTIYEKVYKRIYRRSQHDGIVGVFGSKPARQHASEAAIVVAYLLN
jgi:hypothetical protein